jgi:hypothetical protein
MKTPLDRLYTTKLTLLAVVSSVAGMGLLLVAGSVHGDPAWSWLNGLPVTEIGSALFSTGLIAIFFEFIDRQDADERANQRLRKVLAEEAPAIRDAVVDGFAFKPESLTNVASPATIDKIVENCLAIQLDNRTLAEEAYADLKNQLIGADRAHDMSISVSLTPWESGPASGLGSMFVATIRWEYKTRLTQKVLRFASVSTQDEYRELLQDPSVMASCYFEPIAGLDGGSKEVFELVQFGVNGKSVPARRAARAGAQSYVVTMAKGADPKPDEVTVSYTYRQLVQRNGHLLYVDIGRPTRGLKVDFFYGDCGIQYVNVLDYVSGKNQTRIERLPAAGPTPSVSIGVDGWVWPKAGVGFVWVLADETISPRVGR